MAGLAGGVALAAPALVPTVQAGDATTVGEVVAGLKAAYQGISSIRADFTQVRRDPTTKAEEKQKGKVSLERPRKMRFDFVQPSPKTFVSDGKTLWIYDPSQNQVIEQPDLGTDSGMGVLLDDLGKVDELFNVSLVANDKSPMAHTLMLVPKKAGAFQSLQLTVSKQKYIIEDLVIVDAMNYVTELHFSQVRFNQDVPDSEFVFVAPPGASVLKTGSP